MTRPPQASSHTQERDARRTISFWKKGLGSLCDRPDCCSMDTDSASVPKPSPQLAPSGPCPMPSIAYRDSAQQQFVLPHTVLNDSAGC